jgi:ribosomal protein S18 acetylase RimI-like enzyme
MKVRQYQRGDFRSIMELWVATGMGRPDRGDDEETIERSVSMGGALFVMCDSEEEEKIIGTSWMTFDGRRIHLHHFGILPEFQGQGLSKVLLRESLRFVKEKGYQVKLEVHRSDTKAAGIYQKAGFRYLGDYDVYIIRDLQSIDI